MVAAEQQRGVAAPVTAGIAQSRLQYDSARPNDELSRKEIKRLIADTYRRIDAFEMTEESVVRPSSFQEEALVDANFMNVCRVLEEASNIIVDVWRPQSLLTGR